MSRLCCTVHCEPFVSPILITLFHAVQKWNSVLQALYGAAIVITSRELTVWTNYAIMQLSSLTMSLQRWLAGSLTTHELVGSPTFSV